jgi:hypothetical protein
MRSDQGWLLWYWELGPLHFGVDLATWGAGFIVNLRYPRGGAFHVGPFYLMLDGPDLAEWTKRRIERTLDFLIDRLDRFDDWLDRRRRGRSGK